MIKNANNLKAVANAGNIGPVMATHEPANSPAVKPSDVKGGVKPSAATKAQLNREVAKATNGLASALSARSQEDKARLMYEAECSQAVAEYFHAVDASKETSSDWQAATKDIEQAANHVARAFADAILGGAFDRSTARRKLGEKFGFELSPTTGKQTSKPSEPGNTIAKRVSAVTIAAEYALNGILPDRGGDNLPSLGREKVEEILADFFREEEPITVRAASERLETALREARETVPLEMSPDKINSLAGKIETAAEAIRENTELTEQYSTLLQVIGRIFGYTEIEVTETSITFKAAA